VGEACATYLLICGSSKQVRSQCLVSLYTMMWGSYVRAGGCRGVKVLPLLGGFSCPVCLQHPKKIFTSRNTWYLLPPSSRHLGKLKIFFKFKRQKVMHPRFLKMLPIPCTLFFKVKLFTKYVMRND
jgi:hypothetical protein